MKFENTEVFNFEGALRGMRNSKNSWNKSDSDFKNKIIGDNDIKLAQRLIKKGESHRKFLRQIFVSVDISATRYWWADFDSYKVGITTNSESSMYNLTNHIITEEMFELDEDELNNSDKEHWCDTINYLEALRKKYRETKDFSYYKKLKKALPESFIQKRTVTTNYEVILNMAKQRKRHEWFGDFINWVNTLPYKDELLLMEAK